MTHARHGHSRVRRERRFDEWPLALVLLGCAVAMGLLLVDRHGFRPGATVLGATFGGAALLRAGLPEAMAGLLAVRSRAADVVMLGLLGVAIIVLAGLVPSHLAPQP